uniref:Survival motor neuron domain containing 1 n=2 Tax=Mus TaxID=862507 RepID=A0A494BAA2_MOUSE
MSEDLAKQLASYKAQLQQVEAALSGNGENEDLLKLKKDLQWLSASPKRLPSVSRVLECTPFDLLICRSQHLMLPGIADYCNCCPSVNEGAVSELGGGKVINGSNRTDQRPSVNSAFGDARKLRQFCFYSAHSFMESRGQVHGRVE